MRLLIKQRVFSWTDSYDVYDENENAKYFVKAEFFSWDTSYTYMTEMIVNWELSGSGCLPCFRHLKSKSAGR